MSYFFSLTTIGLSHAVVSGTPSFKSCMWPNITCSSKWQEVHYSDTLKCSRMRKSIFKIAVSDYTLSQPQKAQLDRDVSLWQVFFGHHTNDKWYVLVTLKTDCVWMKKRVNQLATNSERERGLHYFFQIPCSASASWQQLTILHVAGNFEIVKDIHPNSALEIQARKICALHITSFWYQVTPQWN